LPLKISLKSATTKVICVPSSSWNIYHFSLVTEDFFNGIWLFFPSQMSFFQDNIFFVKLRFSPEYWLTHKCHGKKKVLNKDIFPHNMTSMRVNLVIFFAKFCNELIFKTMLIKTSRPYISRRRKRCLFRKHFQTYQSQNWWNANRSNNRTSATDRVSTAMQNANSILSKILRIRKRF
jgi:hypothetical protein